MPASIIRLILLKLGWDRETSPFSRLPLWGNPKARAEDVLCRIVDVHVLPPCGEYGVVFDGAKAQRTTVEATAEGTVLIDSPVCG